MRKQPILLVEDEENDILFMKRALRTAGVEEGLRVVEDGRRALDYLQGEGEFADRSVHPMPGLILLDLKLPYVLGLDVLRWLRGQHDFETLLVVILTSSKEDSDVEAAYRLGANSYLTKTTRSEDLIRRVKCLCEYWLEHNVAPPSVP